MTVFMRLRHVWVGVVCAFIANDVFTFASHVPDIPDNPGGAPLVLATLGWAETLVMLWCLSVQLTFNRRHSRPRMWATRDGARRPLAYRQLGYDPEGVWSYGVRGVVSTAEGLVIERIAPATAVYVVSDIGLVARFATEPA